MATKRTKTATVKYQVGRDRTTGRFLSVATAKRRRKTAVVTTITKRKP